MYFSDPSKKKLIMDLRDSREKCDDYNKNTLNNACRELSGKLYQARSHFFYELVQNAEDNEYIIKVEPEISFFIDKEKILVQNNEKGFIEKDVRSICDIGESSKQKSNIRHDIGEKGIGFKSVFGISDTPRIFSNGYSFGFNANEPLGYIKPTWIPPEKYPRYIDKKLTNILLPLTGDLNKIADLSPINPLVILFLKKIKKISYSNDLNKIKFLITKKNLKNDCISLEEKNLDVSSEKSEIYRFKMVYNKYEIPPEIKEPLRKNKQDSEMELAFPITKETKPDPEKGGMVYSFLPIDSYQTGSEIPFIIQGDFILTSNRGSILSDNEWNKWLRDSISDIFLKAVEIFKRDTNLRYSFYEYIPLKDSIKDAFFNPIGTNILQIIKENLCILDAENEWKKPIDVLRTTDSIRELIPNEVLKKYYNKSLISPKIENYPVLSQLGVQKFNVKNLCNLLGKSEWIKNQSLDWFINLYRLLGKNLTKREISSEDILYSVILKLESGEICTPTVASRVSTKIFLHTEDPNERYISNRNRFILPEISKLIESDEFIRKFFEALNITAVSTIDVINEIIIPIYEGYQEGKITRESLEKSIVYLKTHQSELTKDIIDRLKRIVVLKTKNPTIPFLKSSELYFSKKYQEDLDLESLFKYSTDKPNFLSEDYISNCNNKEEISDWQSFFEKLGVETSFFLFQREFDSDDPIFQECKKEKSGRIIGFIDFYFNPSIENELNHQDKNQSIIWIKYLDSLWNQFKKLSHIIMKIDISWKSKGHYYEVIDKEETQIPAEWIKILRELSWLPTKNNHFLKPSEVYYLDKDIIAYSNMTNKSLPFLPIKVDNVKLLECLGVNCNVNPSFLFDVLRCLKERQDSDLHNYSKIYDYLWENFTKNKDQSSESILNIQKTFSEEALIFIPSSKNCFYTQQDVVWKIESNNKRLNSVFGIVSPFYPHLYNFFVKGLEIIENLSAKDFQRKIINILETQKRLNLPPKRIQQLLIFLYSELNSLINQESDLNSLSDDENWKQFFQNPLFYTTRDEFEKNENNIFLNDDDDLFNLFKDSNDIRFWNIPKPNMSELLSFAKLAQIRLISQHVDIKIYPEVICEENIDLTFYIRQLFPYIFRFLYHKNSLYFSKLSNNDYLDALSKFKIIETDSPKFIFILKSIGHTNIEIIRSDTRDVLLFNNTLYHKKGSVDLESISIQLSKWFEMIFKFSENGGLDDFILALFSKDNEEQKELYLLKKRIEKLPASEFCVFKLILDESSLLALFDPNLIVEDIYESPDMDEILKKFTKYDLKDSRFKNYESGAFIDEESFNVRDKSLSPHLKRNKNAIIDGLTDQTTIELNYSPHNKKRKHFISISEIIAKSSLKQLPIIAPNDPKLSVSVIKFDFQKTKGKYEDLKFVEQENQLVEEKIEKLMNKNFPSAEKANDVFNKSKNELGNKLQSPLSQSRSIFQDSFEDLEGNLNESSNMYRNQNKTQEMHIRPISNEVLKKEIGLWGEEFVYYFLIAQKKDIYPNGKIIKETPLIFIMELPTREIIKILRDDPDSPDSHLSYDIAIIEPDGRFFIEVKSTRNSGENEFLISQAEWNFAQKMGDSYQIYRVEGALTMEPSILIITNPYQMWIDGKLTASILKIKY